MRDEPEAMIQEHKILGCELTALGGFAFGGASEQEWDTFIQQFNAAAEKLDAGGLRLGYHNHSHEWTPFGSPEQFNVERTPIQKMIDGMSDKVWFELDTYWVAFCGGGPGSMDPKMCGAHPGGAREGPDDHDRARAQDV